MLNNEFQTELIENITAVDKLFEEINIDTLDPKVKELITRLYLFQNQNKMLANAAEIQALESKNELLDLISVGAIAEASFQRGMFDPVCPEIQEASTKVLRLYNGLELKAPELKEELFELGEAYSEYLAITSEDQWFKGFNAAIAALKGGQAEHGN